MAHGTLSLKGRALRWLAQREHSREELARKLLRHLAAERRASRGAEARAGKRPLANDPGAAEHAPHVATRANTPANSSSAASARYTPDAPVAPVAADGEAVETAEDAEVSGADDLQRIDTALDALEARGLLSDARAAQSLVNSRASRHGSRRLRQDMQAKGLAPELIDRTLATVVDSEFDRARQLWQRRFGQAPQDLRERARQTRFLLGRGFAGDVIRRVLAEARHATNPSGATARPDDEERVPASSTGDDDGMAPQPGEDAGESPQEETRAGMGPASGADAATRWGRWRSR